MRLDNFRTGQCNELYTALETTAVMVQIEMANDIRPLRDS